MCVCVCVCVCYNESFVFFYSTRNPPYAADVVAAVMSEPMSEVAVLPDQMVSVLGKRMKAEPDAADTVLMEHNVAVLPHETDLVPAQVSKHEVDQDFNQNQGEEEEEEACGAVDAEDDEPVLDLGIKLTPQSVSGGSPASAAAASPEPVVVAAAVAAGAAVEEAKSEAEVELSAAEFEKKLSEKIREQSEINAEDTIRLYEDGWRERYYKEKMDLDLTKDKAACRALYVDWLICKGGGCCFFGRATCDFF
jgi:5'-3' exonuclease